MVLLPLLQVNRHSANLYVGPFNFLISSPDLRLQLFWRCHDGLPLSIDRNRAGLVSSSTDTLLRKNEPEQEGQTLPAVQQDL
jgi:hypothetical protein